MTSEHPGSAPHGGRGAFTRGLLLTITLQGLLACAGGKVSTPLTRAGAERMANGDHAQAYINYRAALYYEISPEARGARPIYELMMTAYQRWIEQQIILARGELDAGETAAGFERLASLVRSQRVRHRWEVREFAVGAQVKPTSPQHAEIYRLLEETAGREWPGVEALQRARHYVPAVILARRLASPFDGEHHLSAKLQALRREGATWHDAAAARAREPHARSFHQAMATRLRGERAARLPELAVPWSAEGVTASCSALYHAVRTRLRQGKHPVVLAFVDDVCQTSTKRWVTNEPYTYTEHVMQDVTRVVRKGSCSTTGGSYQQKFHCAYVDGQQRCGNVAISTPGREICTPDEVRTERQRVPQRRSAHRDVTHEHRTLTWTGIAVITWPGGSERVSFAINKAAEDTAYATAHGTKRITLNERELLKRAADELVQRVRPLEAKIRGSAAATLARDAERARQAGDEQAVDDLHLAAMLAGEPEDSRAYLQRAYGLDHALWQGIHAGVPDPIGPPASTALLGKGLLDLAPDVPVADQQRCGDCYALRGTTVRHRSEVRGGERPAAHHVMAALAYLRPERSAITELGDQLLISATARTRPTRRLQLAWVANLELGAGLGNGMAYGADILPVGVALTLGRARYGLAVGAGFGGVQGGVIPFSWRAPIEAYAMFELTSRLTVTGTARLSYLSEGARTSGTTTDVGADELELTFGMRLDKLRKRGGWGSSGYLGVVYRELMGTSFAGAALGLGY